MGAKTNRDESLRALLRLLIDKIVDDFVAYILANMTTPGVNHAPKLSEPSLRSIYGDADSRALALAKHLQNRRLNKPGRIRFIGNANALFLGGWLMQRYIGEGIQQQKCPERL
jgi:hypothetical protein